MTNYDMTNPDALAKQIKKLAEDYYDAIRGVDPNAPFVVMLAGIGAMIGALMEQWRDVGGDPQKWMRVLQSDIEKSLN